MTNSKSNELKKLMAEIVDGHPHSSGYIKKWSKKVQAQIDKYVQQTALEARLAETKLYLEWFEQSINVHIEDFIEDRMKALKQELEKK